VIRRSEGGGHSVTEVDPRVACASWGPISTKKKVSWGEKVPRHEHLIIPSDTGTPKAVRHSDARDS